MCILVYTVFNMGSIFSFPPHILINNKNELVCCLASETVKCKSSNIIFKPNSTSNLRLLGVLIETVEKSESH